MGENSAFEDIRPYLDREVPKVVEQLLSEPSFYTVMRYVHPDWDEQKVRSVMAKVKTIHDFQDRVAHPSMRKLMDSTIDELSISGHEKLENGESRLFISNHRDIILDSAILNVLLFEKGIGTFQTAIGSNLLTTDLVANLTKLNKNFVVKRNTAAREFYENSMRLSAYIRHVITGQKESIWIAQREGRTKDGLDKTQPGLLKMLSISCDDPLRVCFKNLRVTPVAISYEYDPCDVLKIPELKAISRDVKYEKHPDEDLNSILTGLTGHKGRVHISIGDVIYSDLEQLADYPALNDKLRVLGEIIDKQIYKNYRIWPTNLLAYDILENQVKSKEAYEGLDPKTFIARMKGRLAAANLHAEEDYKWLLSMYANPVRNSLNELA